MTNQYIENEAHVPATLVSRRRKLDTLDKERGNCLMIYKDKAIGLAYMPVEWQMAVLKSLVEWFMGEDEETVIQSAVDLANKLVPAEESKKKNNAAKIKQILKLLMDAQKQNVASYYAKCEQSVVKANKRWHKSNTASQKVYHVDMPGELD